MITELVTLASPVVVYFIMNGVKRVKRVKLSENKKSLLRKVVLPVLSIATLLVQDLAGVGEFDVTSFNDAVTTLVDGAFIYLTSTGIYQIFPSKKRDIPPQPTQPEN